MGAGLGGPSGKLRWGMVRRMAYTWGLTLPAAAVVSGLAALVADRGNWGVAVVGLALVVGAGSMWLVSRRQPVHADNVNDAAPAAAEVPAVVAPAAAPTTLAA